MSQAEACFFVLTMSRVTCIRGSRFFVAQAESGPYHRRKACRLYTRWVHLAGGRVRGTGRDGLSRAYAVDEAAAAEAAEAAENADDALNGEQQLHEDVDVAVEGARRQKKDALVLGGGAGKGARRATRLGSTAALVLRNEAGGGRAELHSHEEAIQARIAFSSPTNDDKPFPSLHAIMTTCS